ncbi:MAG: glycosyltransferase family 2 protein [Parafilimonas sp.]|nr:glycosyltransferase family 2 protein [Parafilimonas sp.]
MRFSFILPVKNGGNYIKECVASILAQTLNDFNIIILENASTDGTAEWLQTLTDERIIVIPSEKSLPIEENWARILSVQKNEFITITGHDDLFDANYLQVMNDLINQHPGASLYQTHFRFINAAGEKIRPCIQMDDKQTASEFLCSFLQRKIDVNGTGFMIRSNDYDSLGGIPAYPNLLFADFELWINVTKIAYKVTSEKECFSFRLHKSTTTISADIKMQKAFEQFIFFLHSLQINSECFDRVIQKEAIEFIHVWCKGLAHRLLRTPKEKRNGLSVSHFLFACKSYADLLVPNNLFNPLKDFSIKIANEIDRFPISRNLFLLFKKIYPKPIF